MDRDNFFTQEKNYEMRNRFENLLLSIDREGKEKLVEYIRKSDFYHAPASTRFHNAVRGGLLAHSLSVYDILNSKIGPTSGTWPTPEKDIRLENDSIIIAGLLHDLCKTYFYKETTKNVKHYEPEIVEAEMKNGGYAKTDAMGRFVWVTEKAYEVDDKCPYGHGEKSVMMIEQFIHLKGVERYMIRWHMGFSDLPDNRTVATLSTAMEMYPSIIAMQEADMEASYFVDVRE